MTLSSKRLVAGTVGAVVAVLVIAATSGPAVGSQVQRDELRTEDIDLFAGTSVTGSVTSEQAARRGLDGRDVCTAVDTLAIVRVIGRTLGSVRSDGGYITDAEGVIDFAAEALGGTVTNATDPSQEDPSEQAHALCWYRGQFSVDRGVPSPDGDPASERLAARSLVVEIPDLDLRRARLLFASTEQSAIFAPPMPEAGTRGASGRAMVTLPQAGP